MSRSRTRFLHRLGLASLVSRLVASPAVALERDTPHYPAGTSTVMPALLPPPGETRLLNYVSYYTTDRANDSKGNSSIPGFRFTAVAEAPRLLHTWTAINDVSWASGIVLVAVYKYIHLPGASANGAGFGDLVIQPLLLSTAFGDLHVFTGFDVSLPTGAFNKKDLVNPGLNYATYAPQAAVTWLPTKDLELSLFSVLGFNTRNPSTRYTSGNYLAIDYAVGYRPIRSLPALQTSVVGYTLRQFTDDTVGGHRFMEGHRAQTFAIGPQVRYDFRYGSVILKWQHEIATRNWPLGNHVQLQLGSSF